MSKPVLEDREGHPALARLQPRHATLYVGLAAGIIAFAVGLWLAPPLSFSLGANGVFVGFLGATALKLPLLSAEYLRKHARDEDTPAWGIVGIVLLVVVASVVSLILALNSGGAPDPVEVALGVSSVLLGWFTVQAMGALHYAYEFYQAPGTDSGTDIEGGFDFPGDEDPDGVAFMYYSFTVGTSVATSDTKVTSNRMRKRVLVHLVFSHLFNTIILAAAVNVLLSLGGGGGGG